MLLLAMLAWLQSQPDWKSLGAKAAASGDLVSAAGQFAKACSANPKDEDGCYFLARALYTLGNHQLAESAFAKALAAASRGNRERVERAAALNHLALDQPVQAEIHFKEAVRARAASDGSSEDARIDYGGFLIRQGRADEAARLLDLALKDNGESPRANLESGRALLHLGRTAEAVRRLEAAVKLNPSVPAARLLLGRAYLQLGRTEDGERELRYGSSTVK